MIREDFLMQNAFSEWDYTCPLNKTAWMLKNICFFYDCAFNLLNKDTEGKLTWERVKRKMKNQYTALTEMKFKNPALPADVMNADFQGLYNSIKAGFSNEF